MNAVVVAPEAAKADNASVSPQLNVAVRLAIVEIVLAFDTESAVSVIVIVLVLLNVIVPARAFTQSPDAPYTAFCEF